MIMGKISIFSSKQRKEAEDKTLERPSKGGSGVACRVFSSLLVACFVRKNVAVSTHLNNNNMVTSHNDIYRKESCWPGLVADESIQ